MAGDGVSVLDLESAVERVGTDGLVAFFLGGEVGVIGQDAFVQGLGLLIGQRRGVGGKRIQEHFHLHFLVAVVGEGEAGVGKMKAVALLEMADPHERRNIPIRNVIRAFQGVQVVVFHHHQLVAADQLLVPVEDLGTDAQVVSARPFVGAAQDDDLVLAVTGIGVRKGLQKLAAADAHDVRKTVQAESEGVAVAALHHFAQMRGIHEDTGILRLPDHRGERHERHAAEDRHILRRKGRRGVQSHGRQLRRIPDEDEPAVHPRADEIHQVGQQIPRAEGRTAFRRDSDQRHFVHHEKGVPRLVRTQRELAETALERLLAVDVLMDGGRRAPGVLRQHFGRAAGRRQQHGFHFQGVQGGDDRRHRRRLARSGIAVHHQDVSVV